ncbi:MAG: nitrate reductase cytochrome c-type subunit [Deltaproteobacteria bacterium]|nr:nitrate reductase cytochrome c-type subunit [Deltaproteobacteria bacterium]
MNTKYGLLALLAGFLLAGGTVLTAFAGPVSEDDISLRKEKLETAAVAAAPEYFEPKPGNNKLYARDFPGAPPMVPHEMKGSMRQDANDCLDCHLTGKDKAPKIPPSHQIKARMENKDPSKVKKGQLTSFAGFYRVEKVSGSRYGCDMCHAAQVTNFKPLVDNTFKPTSLKDDPKDLLEKLNKEGTF